MKIALTGDVMLGRGVDEYVIRNGSLAPHFIWGDVLPLLASATVRLINLECVISHIGWEWRPDSKAFHFRAHPRAVDVLQAGRIDGVTLANNHSLDFGPDALLDCVARLDRVRILHAGAGKDLEHAMAPMILPKPAGSVAVISITDNEPEWAAGPGQPGVNHIEYDERGLAEPYRSRLSSLLAVVRRQDVFVIVGAHVGPNWGSPSAAMRALARSVLDLGADLYWGHSNHTPQGIEIYKNKPIIYSAGDFIDDYAVRPDERNDLSFLFHVNIEGKAVERVELYPVAIEGFSVRRASGREAEFLERRMRAECRRFGTRVEVSHGVATILTGS